MTEIPCCKCGGVVIDEFSVPSELWNAVMRPDGHETDQEYLCFECWNGTLNVYITRLRLLVAELKVDAENLSRALSMHDLEYGDIRIIGKHRSLMSKVDEVMK